MESKNQDVNLTDDQVIDLFIEGLMQEKGIELGDEPYKNDIFVELKNRLLTEIDRSLVAELPDEKLDEFSKVVAKDGKIDPAVIAQAVQEAGLNVEEIVGTTMAKFKEIYLGESNSRDEKQETGAAEEA